VLHTAALKATTWLALYCPVCRYYSAFNYYRWWMKEQKPPTPDDFHSQAVKDVQQWRDCVAASTVAECVRRFQPQQLVKGVYAQFLPVGDLAGCVMLCPVLFALSTTFGLVMWTWCCCMLHCVPACMRQFQP
jgi:hypothetical protein